MRGKANGWRSKNDRIVNHWAWRHVQWMAIQSLFERQSIRNDGSGSIVARCECIMSWHQEWGYSAIAPLVPLESQRGLPAVPVVAHGGC